MDTTTETSAGHPLPTLTVASHVPCPACGAQPVSRPSGRLRYNCRAYCSGRDGGCMVHAKVGGDAESALEIWDEEMTERLAVQRHLQDAPLKSGILDLIDRVKMPEVLVYVTLNTMYGDRLVDWTIIDADLVREACGLSLRRFDLIVANLVAAKALDSTTVDVEGEHPPNRRMFRVCRSLDTKSIDDLIKGLQTAKDQLEHIAHLESLGDPRIARNLLDYDSNPHHLTIAKRWSDFPQVKGSVYRQDQPWPPF